jgi:citrate lyase subunit beta/citryl-CoA lyase
VVGALTLTPLAPLFVPASRPERFHKADVSAADAIIVDLEDAVAPEQKCAARENLANHVAAFTKPLIVRINAPETPWRQADVQLLGQLKPAALMLPKTLDADDVRQVAAQVGREVALIPLIESARALSRLAQILDVPGVALVAFGSIDFARDLGCSDDPQALLAVRTEIVWRSRAADRNPPLDGVSRQLEQIDLVEKEARQAADLGFGGKMAIHPAQLEAIRRAFRPADSEVDWARRVLAAGGTGAAARLDGQMVDQAVIERAHQLLARRRRVDADTSAAAQGGSAQPLRSGQ